MQSTMRAVGSVKGDEVKYACFNCGDDMDTVIETVCVTEGNYEERVQCRDRMACWERKDRLMGLDCGMSDLIRQRDEQSLMAHENGYCDG